MFEAGLSAQVDIWSVGARSAAAAEPASELPPEPKFTPPD